MNIYEVTVYTGHIKERIEIQLTKSETFEETC